MTAAFLVAGHFTVPCFSIPGRLTKLVDNISQLPKFLFVMTHFTLRASSAQNFHYSFLIKTYRYADDIRRNGLFNCKQLYIYLCKQKADCARRWYRLLIILKT